MHQTDSIVYKGRAYHVRAGVYAAFARLKPAVAAGELSAERAAAVVLAAEGLIEPPAAQYAAVWVDADGQFHTGEWREAPEHREGVVGHFLRDDPKADAHFRPLAPVIEHKVERSPR